MLLGYGWVLVNEVSNDRLRRGISWRLKLTLMKKWIKVSWRLNSYEILRSFLTLNDDQLSCWVSEVFREAWSSRVTLRQAQYDTLFFHFFWDLYTLYTHLPSQFISKDDIYTHTEHDASSEELYSIGVGIVSDESLTKWADDSLIVQYMYICLLALVSWSSDTCLIS